MAGTPGASVGNRLRRVGVGIECVFPRVGRIVVHDGVYRVVQEGVVSAVDMSEFIGPLRGSAARERGIRRCIDQPDGVQREVRICQGVFESGRDLSHADTGDKASDRDFQHPAVGEFPCHASAHHEGVPAVVGEAADVVGQFVFIGDAGEGSGIDKRPYGLLPGSDGERRG